MMLPCISWHEGAGEAGQQNSLPWGLECQPGKELGGEDSQGNNITNFQVLSCLGFWEVLKIAFSFVVLGFYYFGFFFLCCCCFESFGFFLFWFGFFSVCFLLLLLGFFVVCLVLFVYLFLIVFRRDKQRTPHFRTHSQECYRHLQKAFVFPSPVLTAKSCSGLPQGLCNVL